MRLIGYTDCWTVRPGETVGLHVSSAADRFHVSIVKLRHGDEHPDGPGFKADDVASAIDGSYPGTWHDVPAGSHARVDGAQSLLNDAQVTIAVWVSPTAPGARIQTIISRGVEGFALALDRDGRPWMTAGSLSLPAADRLLTQQWYLLVGRLDRTTGTADLQVIPRDLWPGKTRADAVARPGLDVRGWEGPLFFAAQSAAGGVTNHFNGKIDSPRIYSRWLSDQEIAALHGGDASRDGLVEWDFGADQADLVIASTGGHFPARLVGMPTRAVTGHRWTGTALTAAENRDHYTAIHFHDDDRDDAGWPEALRLKVASDWPSAIYAFRLTSDDGDEDYVPFFLLPSRDGPHAAIAFLAPTFSYLAYGNAHLTHALPADPDIREALAQMRPAQPQDLYIHAQNLYSGYDLHSDGSGVAYVSRLLPQVNVRPKVKFRHQGSAHQFNADLHIVDWLHAKGFGHDVLTDEALHEEGVDLLTPYRVIVTGSHPEYWSGAMLDALERYLHSGGRVMYLGGNGFYWVTSVHRHAPHVLEFRKWNGTRTWEAGAGERHHSTTGEQGGLWRDRGRAPQRLVAVGMTGEGFDVGAAYRRTPESYADAVSFIFDGVADDVFGDTPSLVLNYGAAGHELDRVDFSLGSPPTTICLAQSFGHSENYMVPSEDLFASADPGPNNPLLRADMAYAAFPNGGAVFSVGSISFGGSLSYNGYDNDVSRITENVLRRFNREAGSGIAT